VSTHKTVGRKGGTRAESIVAPPDARLKTCFPLNAHSVESFVHAHAHVGEIVSST
jgi:hypothetical protein